MKDKFMVFIIGLLLGAVLTAAGFLIYEKTNNNNNNMPNFDNRQMMERPEGEAPPDMPNGMENNGTRPELPSKNDTSRNDDSKNNKNI